MKDLQQPLDPCYSRKSLGIDVLARNFITRDLEAVFSQKQNRLVRLTDLRARQMEAMGLLAPGAAAAWEQAAPAAFGPLSAREDLSAPALEAVLQDLRRSRLGPETLEAWKARVAPDPFLPPYAIDQRPEKDRLVSSAGSVLLVLTDPSLRPLLEADARALVAADKRVWAALDPEPGRELPMALDLPGVLPAGAERPEAVLFYGEEGFLHCRGLAVPGVVHARPRGFFARALTNTLGCAALPCVVLVPAGTDMTRYVPLNRKTRLTFWHLAKLRQRLGSRVETLDLAQLYREAPDLFMNIYSRRETPWPLDLGPRESLAAYDAAREAALGTWLESLGIRWYHRYFDEELRPAPICYDPDRPQGGILVTGARLSRSRGAKVVSCGAPPRTALAGEDRTALVSNFLFFLTPKLGLLYNDLRRDRPREQADAAAGHLDYLLCRKGGRRRETFPLFAKACMAQREDGRFLFFHYRLGGGQLRLGGRTYRWEKAQVDPQQPGDLAVFTPMGVRGQEDADRDTFAQPVGAGRVNLVILQDRVTALRRGDVLLPSVGVVLSLSEAAAAPLLAELPELENGYFDPRGLEPELCLDGPEEVDPAVWAKVRWAYGGGMTLVDRGESLCGPGMEEAFRREGWFNPLSRQTQESSVHTLVKHPRTALGLAGDGELVLLVFSGRTWRSAGADYREMCAIAKQLVPDLQVLMNADGGASAVLGLVHRGDFMELSYPSTSARSCAGMTRPVHTLLVAPLENR